jgi:hypothetical protein
MRHEANTGTGKCASPRVLELERMSLDQLERVFLDGSTPDLDKIAGWEFRGLNSPTWARMLGIKKFIKGFYKKGDDDGVYGYNCPAVQNKLGEPWIARPDDENPKRFGFYKVEPVDPGARDNEYLHSVLLDYGKGGNPRTDPSKGLRDYLVQVDADNEDIYLGKAYFAIGPLRLPTFSFFILERHRPGLTDVSVR